MQIIPALYIKEGKPAIYRPGDYDRIEFLPYDPYDLIDEISRHHVQRIYIVDVDASLQNTENNKALIVSLANTTIPDLEVGGGINNIDYIKSLQYSGVDYFVLGSVVFENFAFLEEISQAKHIGNEKIMISLDLLDGKLTSHGWTMIMDDATIRSMIKKCIDLGFSRFICTDINSTHRESGPDILFYKELVEQFPDVLFAASGQINTFEDIDNLKAVGIKEAIVGNSIYRDFSLLDRISEYNRKETQED
ncbi:MAG: HisA/HisF-related TIM barrel protein [Bacteroidia bacterium]|nr:HisA/HisF-related TIM barrel protein [Bacteroidia bacterium]